MATQVFGIFAALIVLALVFGVVEHFWPSLPRQRRFRRGWKTDVAWWFWVPLVTRPLTVVAVIAAALLVTPFLGLGFGGDAVRALAGRETFAASQPAWLQAGELLVLFDLAGYWSHRMFHRRSVLWRFHAVHHSSMDLDWLSSVRVHPLNELGQRAAQAVSLLLLGFEPGLVAAYVPLFTFWAIGLHANVGWDFGPLRYLVASPRFHRWHHTSEADGMDRNFAGLFPWIDALFGTLYLPQGRVPREFGIPGEAVPAGLLQQLWYPFRERVPAPAATLATRSES